jgi:hypothetical protein
MKTLAETYLENAIWIREMKKAGGKPVQQINEDIKRLQADVLAERDAKLREEMGMLP